MTVIVIVEKRSDDYKAYIKGSSNFWDCGPTREAAIGNLLISHTDKFDLEIQYKHEDGFFKKP